MEVKILLSIVCIVCMILSIKVKALPYFTSLLSVSLLLGWLTVYSMIFHILLLVVLLVYLFLDKQTLGMAKISLGLLFMFSSSATIFQYEGWPGVDIFSMVASLPVLAFLMFIKSIWKTPYRYCALMLWVIISQRFLSFVVQF